MFLQNFSIFAFSNDFTVITVYVLRGWVTCAMMPQ